MLNELLLGIGVGIALGLTGSGGTLAVPALMLGLGMTIEEARPVSLIAIGISSLIGTIDGFRHGLVRYRAALVMAAFGITASPLGIKAAAWLPTHALTTLFSLLLLFIAARMGWHAWHDGESRTHVALSRNCMLREETGRFQWNPKCFFTLAAIGALAGFNSGLLGVGGGFLIVPGIQQFSNLGMHGIVATSLAVITLVSSGTVLQSLAHGAVITESGWYFIGATGVGLLVGRLWSPYLSARILQFTFAGLASVVAAMLFAKYW
ncbi:sulfite exporter TauE/SafE family protein [Parathalassolituus penaei]|uniref:Probable membrane transporter protein n=1 Tax=Parathalassolituus penaei TaxID=2997323 RepID=A0A9X3EQI6_9GAMM|nr:sulfite exporter TauE/SafE family protein [Parathalassolituus penaei]MCY0967033.1 sulfite exporter TauE/SafE family protein [Parathalassolituus penaei]